MLLAGCGSAKPRPHPSPTPAPVEVTGSGLAIGITEPNPAFLVGGGPPAFARWQPALAAIRPDLYRLVVDWSALTDPDGTRIDLHRRQPGCMRALGPCAGFGGVGAQLRALAAAQRADPGHYQGMVVFLGTPAALAAPPGGCEKPGTQPRSRPTTSAIGLARYRQAVAAVRAEARRVGASVPYWSPWNEPNHPYTLSPQRPRCSDTRDTVSPEPYAALAESMLSVLGPQDHLVLGETAGFLRGTGIRTSVGQFIRSLPASLVCRASVYGEHAYLGARDPVGAVVRALRRFPCPVPPVWITETGVKRSHTRAACARVARRLDGWWRDPRVAAAFQYTLREDDRFPTGLVSTDLRQAFPVLGLWQAWGRRSAPAAPPPAHPCGAT